MPTNTDPQCSYTGTNTPMGIAPIYNHPAYNQYYQPHTSPNIAPINNWPVTTTPLTWDTASISNTLFARPLDELQMHHVRLRVYDPFLEKRYTMVTEDAHKLLTVLKTSPATKLTIDTLTLFLKKFEIMCPDLTTEVVIQL